MTTQETNYELIEGGAVPIKCWTKNGRVSFEENAKLQARGISNLDCVAGISIMPDVHTGYDVPIGSVVATRKAIVPQIVSGDIGCGVSVIKTTLTSHQVSENGQDIFDALTEVVPINLWQDSPPGNVKDAWDEIEPAYRKVVEKNGKASSKDPFMQLGSQGKGNHLFSVNLDENDNIWFMVHSGSRGAGNRIGQCFFEMAKKDMEKQDAQLPNKNLSYFKEGTQHFDEYFEAVQWAQNYAFVNRQLMLENAVRGIKQKLNMKFQITDQAVNCHHNYVELEHHFGEDVYITRKGAVSARDGQKGVILGCMGGKSYIVTGKGNADSFNSCSHGAGRMMSRTIAKNTITHDQHIQDTEGVFCRKDAGVRDESPRAYKNIDDVMSAQTDLVDIIHSLKEIVCIKG